jgi:hypothetical protein
VEFPPTKYSTLALTQTDHIITTATNLTKIIEIPPPLVPFHDVSTYTLAAITKLAAIFHRMSTPPTFTTSAIPPRVLTTTDPTVAPPRVVTTSAPTRVKTENNPPRQPTISIISQETDPHSPRPERHPHQNSSTLSPTRILNHHQHHGPALSGPIILDPLGRVSNQPHHRQDPHISPAQLRPTIQTCMEQIRSKQIKKISIRCG